MYKPYVVSADIKLLMSDWAAKHGYTVPSDIFFHQLRQRFSSYMCNIFPHFELVGEEEITSSLAKLIAQTNLPVVSLDRVYFKNGIHFEVARHVDEKGESRGLWRRAGYPTVMEQVRILCKKEIKEVVLVDDVIFEGIGLERIIKIFSRAGIQVPAIYAAVGISQGVTKLRNLGCQVNCVRTFDQVIDEICERDFYPGVPLSGRHLLCGENVGVPYLLPFGNPEKWASIPKDIQNKFSVFCIKETITLFEEIERCSEKVINCEDLDRKVIGLPYSGARYCDALRLVLNKLVIA
jgi:hypothetical protein